MVETTKSAGVADSHAKIQKIIESSTDLSATPDDTRAVHMELSKMPDRWNRQVVSQTVDVLFESA